MGKYDEIINLPHHVSKHRNKMSNYDRAAQFAPFAALTGYDATILETARLTYDMIELSEENKDLNNRKLQLILQNIKSHPIVTIKYFSFDELKEGGSYIEKTGSIKRIEPELKKIVYTDGFEINFEQIYELNSDLFDGMND